jgi:8-oxo-dGTP pyrophosphatase MutT (NUDIX family)
VRIVSRHLVDGERQGSYALVDPKDAATLIIIDGSSRSPEVLLGRRHLGHAFMPGKFVFPGGSVDATDWVMAARAPLHPVIERRLFSQTGFTTGSDVAALPLAAVRETFEETGFLVGKWGFAKESTPEGAWTKFVQTGVVPAPRALHFIARAITPPGFPHRFDARFFCVNRQEVAHHLEGVVHADAELVELVWLPIRQAMELDMPLITGLVLEELRERISAGFDRDLPVPFYTTRDGEFTRALIE